MILLNIGEDTNDGRKVLPDKVISALHLAGALPIDMTGHVSDTEYTYVIRIPRELSEREVKDLSLVLDQDAVAYWDGRNGFLAGPYAAKWGKFNPDYFLTLTGDRLSDTFRKAA
jgi:hypothetical protein